jgi:hypothetical protein
LIIKNLGKIFFLIFFPIFLFADVIFNQKVVKNKAYLNETIRVILELSVSNDLEIEQVDFEKYETFDFWIKEFVSKKITKNQNETIYTYEYLLDAKNIGEFVLPKQTIEITSQEIRKFKKWQKVYSNEEKITVLPLYENQAIQGNYTINLNIDKTKIKANESITLNLEMNGRGNIQDIKAFDLSLNEQMIYKDKPIITKEFMDDSYQGKFTQKFMIIANKSFTIPSFQFEYFDLKKNIVKKVSTEPIYIEVEELPILQKENSNLKYIFAFIGFVLGLFSLFLYKYSKNYYKKINSPFSIKIKKTKSDKELYDLLIKHPNNSNFKDTIKLLEENIYENKKNKIDKKKLFNITHI